MFKKVMIPIFICLFVVTSVYAAEKRGTTGEAKKMVEKAIAYIKANGQEKAFAEINNPKGRFVDRDLYITVIDMNGLCVARGFNPDLLGKNISELKDPDGKYFIKERIEVAKTKGSGWQDYKFTDPLTKNVEPKKAYFKRYKDIIVMCGAYKPKK
jgi:signal transduction histidine kinase